MAKTYASVPEMFIDRVHSTPDRLAYQYPSDGGWKNVTWKEMGERVRVVASGLKALGLQPEQRCAILSGTRIEWIVADLGILCGGGATTTIYPSSTADECAYILKDSNTVFAFAENEEQVQKLMAKRAELPGLKKVVVFEGQGGHGGWVISLAELSEQGKAYEAQHPGDYEKGVKAVKASDLATLIYTSGTTGKPKGVELTHDCWVYEGEAIDALGILSEDTVQYLWLPLAHSFGKVMEAAQLRIGFPTAVDGRVDKLVANLAVIKPLFVCAVPRIFEKVHNKVLANAREGGELKYKIFQWAFSVGREVSELQQRRKQPTGLLALKHAVADKLVFSKIRALFGGKLRFFISGSAPLSREMAEFFHAAGILILEGYGLTESSAGSFVNKPDSYKFGTVGPAFRGTQVRIAPEDGEILLKGRGIMRGYHGLPEATHEALTSDGWLRTGDIGEVDTDGLLKITDRKKDLIKTSGGKYVAPQALEGKLKAICPYLSQAVVHGDKRNFCSALITLEDEAARKWARESGLGEMSYAELSRHPKAIALIQSYIDQLNAELPGYSTVKKFALLPADLTEAAGELTASLKVKRKVVEQKYKRVLDDFYKESLAVA